MKNILLTVTCLSYLLLPVLSRSQSFTQADTVRATVYGSGSIADNITVTGSGALNIKYHVTATNFPADWLTQAAFGICDMSQCRNNIGDTMLWNRTDSVGGSFTCSYPGAQTNPFSLSPDLTAATTSGTYYVTILVEVTGLGGGYSKPTTFVISKAPASVPGITNTEDRFTLYPNPATNEVNVVYDPNANVKNIAVYSIIGKVMSVYRVTGNSANLNIENIPSGVYFVRAFNSNGNVVATRKFTKQ